MTTLQAPVSVMPLSAQVAHICALRAQGLTYREIATQTGLSPSTVGVRLRDDDARDILEDATKHHIRSLPLAIARHQELIASDDETIALNATKLQYQITGIMPSHAQPVYIGKLMIQQTNILDPESSRLLTRALGLPMPEDDIQDAEIVGESETE